MIALLRDGVGERAALAFVYAGLAILGMAWLYLGRALRRGEEGTDTGRLLKIAALWGAPLVFCVPLFSRDLYAYAAQAQIAHAGLDPYRFGPVSLPGPFLDEISGMWVDTPAPYGPLFLGIGRAVATVAGDRVVTTVFVLRLVAVVGLLLTARYLPRLARAAGGDPRVAVWLGIANPLVLVHFVAGGHNDALMIGLVVAGLTVAIEATEERWSPSASSSARPRCWSRRRPRWRSRSWPGSGPPGCPAARRWSGPAFAPGWWPRSRSSC